MWLLFALGSAVFASLTEEFGKRIDKQIIIHPKNFSFENDVIKIPPYMLWYVF